MSHSTVTLLILLFNFSSFTFIAGDNLRCYSCSSLPYARYNMPAYFSLTSGNKINSSSPFKYNSNMCNEHPQFGTVPIVGMTDDNCKTTCFQFTSDRYQPNGSDVWQKEVVRGCADRLLPAAFVGSRKNVEINGTQRIGDGQSIGYELVFCNSDLCNSAIKLSTISSMMMIALTIALVFLI